MFLIIAFLTSLTFQNPTPSQELPVWIQADFKGVGLQIDGKEWSVHLRYNPHTKSLEIGYPSLACSGLWTIKNVEAHHLSGTETIMVGTNNCDQGVLFEVFQMEEDKILVEYYIPWFSQNPIAWAELKKVETS